MVYINSDIIVSPGFSDVLNSVRIQKFLACGRRWDLNIESYIDYSDNNWEKKLRTQINEKGKLHGPSGIDYLVFPKNMFKMPEFAVGRPGWDVWLIWYCKNIGIPVIDATDSIVVVHQNHDYSHSKHGEKKELRVQRC